MMQRGAASDASSVGAALDPSSRGSAWDPLLGGEASDASSRGAASNPPFRGAAWDPLSGGEASDASSRGAAWDPLSRGAASNAPPGSHDGTSASRAMFGDAAGSGVVTSSTPALSAVPTIMSSSSQLSDSTREMSVQSDAAVLSDDSEDSYVTTSSSDASLRSDTDTSSSYAVASSDSHYSVFPRCTVQTRPALGHDGANIATTSDVARTRHRMVLPPVLRECTHSTTIESHFSPVTSDGEAASPPDGAPTSSEGRRRTAASVGSGRSITFSGIHSRSTEPRTQGGSTSVGRTSTGTSGRSSYLDIGSMRTRPRLIGAPRATTSVGSSDERRLGTSTAPRSQNQVIISLE